MKCTIVAKGFLAPLFYEQLPILSTHFFHFLSNLPPSPLPLPHPRALVPEYQGTFDTLRHALCNKALVYCGLMHDAVVC